MQNDYIIPALHIANGKQIYDTIQVNINEIINLIKETYLLHQHGLTTNPISNFLRFTNNPNARIIALPAAIQNAKPIAGIKWIASFPANTNHGLPRASAILILNDEKTGYPYACMEASTISAARTAASAVLGAYYLNNNSKAVDSISFIGCGFIAKYIFNFLIKSGWKINKAFTFDTNANLSKQFSNYINENTNINCLPTMSKKDAINNADLVVIATNTLSPHINKKAYFNHNPIVLHISLRDLAPNIIANAYNYCDDITHCLRENTSLYLTNQVYKNTDFIKGTIAELITKKITNKIDKPRIFSPFGLGITDIALGNYIFQKLQNDNQLTTIDNFFIN